MTSDPPAPNRGSDESPEERVVRLVRARDEQGISILLDELGPRIKAALMRTFGRRRQKQIDDAVCDAACTVWYKIDKFDPTKGRFSRWFIWTAYYTLVAELREQNVQQLSTDSGVTDGSEVPGSNDESRPSKRRQDVQNLHDAIRKLSDKQKSIIRSDLDEFSKTNDESLASKLGTSANSVRVLRNRAHHRLVKLMGGEGT